MATPQNAFEDIRYREENGLATITLTRPERRNALTKRMRGEVIAALALATQTARAVQIEGAGGAFCAGQDLEELLNVDDMQGMLENEYAPFFTAVSETPIPIIAAVGGAAAGAGLHLALACDIILAARSAKFASPFAKLALTPAGGGSWFLPRRIGHARAVGFAMSGEAIDAETAERWGMIWRVVEDDALATEAQALGQKLAQGPTRAFGLTKQLLADSWSAGSLSEQLKREAVAQNAASQLKDYHEGVEAFLAKRKPSFSGE